MPEQDIEQIVQKELEIFSKLFRELRNGKTQNDHDSLVDTNIGGFKVLSRLLDQDGNPIAGGFKVPYLAVRRQEVNESGKRNPLVLKIFAPDPGKRAFETVSAHQEMSLLELAIRKWGPICGTNFANRVDMINLLFSGQPFEGVDYRTFDLAEAKELFKLLGEDEKNYLAEKYGTPKLWYTVEPLATADLSILAKRKLFNYDWAEEIFSKNDVLPPKKPKSTPGRKEIKKMVDELITMTTSVQEAGAVHRDIKPANVYAYYDGTHWKIKLGDFDAMILPNEEWFDKRYSGYNPISIYSIPHTPDKPGLADMVGLGYTLNTLLTGECIYEKGISDLKNPEEKRKKIREFKKSKDCLKRLASWVSLPFKYLGYGTLISKLLSEKFVDAKVLQAYMKRQTWLRRIRNITIGTLAGCYILNAAITPYNLTNESTHLIGELAREQDPIVKKVSKTVYFFQWKDDTGYNNAIIACYPDLDYTTWCDGVMILRSPYVSHEKYQGFEDNFYKSIGSKPEHSPHTCHPQSSNGICPVIVKEFGRKAVYDMIQNGIPELTPELQDLVEDALQNGAVLLDIYPRQIIELHNPIEVGNTLQSDQTPDNGKFDFEYTKRKRLIRLEDTDHFKGIPKIIGLPEFQYTTTQKSYAELRRYLLQKSPLKAIKHILVRCIKNVGEMEELQKEIKRRSINGFPHDLKGWF